jgi:leader peptidase (prepilin peptidase)/N-methyltransferase
MQYPLVELLTALLLTLLFLKTGIGILFVIYALFTSSLIVITFIDLRLQIIPDIISLPGIVAGFLFSFLPGGIGWLDSFIGILAGGGVLYLVAWGYFTLTKRDGMGGGDIKLLGMIGAFLGWQSIPFVIFVSAAAGALVGITFLLIHGKDMKFAIPFGPFLSGAAVCYIFFGKEVTEWYISISTIH